MAFPGFVVKDTRGSLTMPGLLKKIEAMALDSHQPVKDLLRQCLVLAHRLGLKEFIAWAKCELDGYPDANLLPDYRKTLSACYGTFSNGCLTYKNDPIPTVRLPKELKDYLETVNCIEPIGSVEKLAAEAPSGGSLKLQLNPNIISVLNSCLKCRDGYQLEFAYREVASTFPQGVIERVQNKVLSFVLDVQSMGVVIDEDEEAFPPAEVQAQMQQIFNTNFYGNASCITAGVHGNVSVAVNNGVAPGDLASLLSAVAKLGLEAEHQASLEKAIQADAGAEPGRASRSLGKQVLEWCGDFTEKVMSGVATAMTIDKLPILMGLIKSFAG